MSKTVSFRFKKGNKEHAEFANTFLKVMREKAGYVNCPTKYAPDVAPVTSAEPDSGLESVPAVESDTQPRG